MGRANFLTLGFSFAIVAASLGGAAYATEPVSLFQRTLSTDLKDPVTLSVSLSRGNVEIGYARDDEVAIYASGQDASGKYLPQDFFEKSLVIDQKDNHVSIRDSPGPDSLLIDQKDNHVSRRDSPGPDSLLSALYTINYRIEVPYRTEVESTVSGIGNQILTGVYGPARLVSGAGDISAQYVRFALLEAKTGKGNISCTRCFGVNAETGEGNITLMENGSSKATVKTGRGRIEVAGARGTFDGSTDAGMLHIKAVPSDDWQLRSNSGTIRVELPPEAKFEIDAHSDSGEVAVEREDMQKPDTDAHQLHQQVNGGGKHITAGSIKGSISIE